jgi:hypothetical protein
MHYTEYVEACNTPLWKNLKYADGQEVKALTQEEFEAQALQAARVRTQENS